MKGGGVRPAVPATCTTTSQGLQRAAGAGAGHREMNGRLRDFGLAKAHNAPWLSLVSTMRYHCAGATGVNERATTDSCWWTGARLVTYTVDPRFVGDFVEERGPGGWCSSSFVCCARPATRR